MAIHENLANSIANKEKPFEELWENHSGMEVEDFITRNMIVEGNYDSNSELLLLKRADGTSIDVTVSVQTPLYLYGIINYGVRLDGTVYNGNELLMLYRDGRKVELGIAIQSVADRSGTQNTVQKPFSVTVKFNNISKVYTVYPISHEYFKSEGTGLVLNIPEDQKAEDIVVWIDVTDFLKKSCKGKTFETSFKLADNEGVTLTYSNTLATSITNEVINLVYKGSTVIQSDSIELMFDPNTTVKDNYKLSGYIGTTSFNNLKGVLTITGLLPGLNQISVRAVHAENPDIYTDWLTFDVIYAAEGYTKTAVAVNGVSSHITNNGIASLYELTIYSPNSEEFEIVTYLEDDVPSDQPNPSAESILKQEIINPSSYDINTNTATSTYKKYIEVVSDNATKYLLIKVDGEFYTFQDPGIYRGENFLDSYQYKEMTIEAIIEEYTYVSSYTTSVNFDQIVGQANNVFVTKAYSSASKPATVIDNIESSDGWHDDNGRTYFKVSALPKDIFVENGLNIALQDNFTIELGVKTYNVSDVNSNILNIGRLCLRPTSVNWILDLGSLTPEKYQEELLKRISKFLEEVETHIVITLNSKWCVSDYPDFYYPDYLGEEEEVFKRYVESTRSNLVRIYINGTIDREFIISDTDVQDLKKAVAQIHTEGSDVDFYLFRVYNNVALDFSEVLRNYISFLPNKTGRGSKEDIYNRNDILDDRGIISWERCQGKLNTLLYVYPTGGYFPHRFWGGEDGDTNNPNKKAHVTMFINYADPHINVQYGGRLNRLQVKGLGSSAMRYLIWNVGALMKKHTEKVYDELGQPVLNAKGEQEEKAINSYFKPQGLLQPESIPEDYTAIEGLKELKNCYYMPPYEGLADPNASKYPYSKMVGKVNYASSMQSHKIGACKLFSDAYYKSLGALHSGGLKAVHEEPFMYFYLETDLSNDQVAEMTWEEVMTMTDQIKFMGFQTWGPGKGDKPCSGYDKNLTPEYLMLEGGENSDETVNFLVPWMALQRGNQNIGSDTLSAQPTITKSESLEHPEHKLWIDDESVVFKTDDAGKPSGAWDIDFGCEEVEKDASAGILKGYFKFDDKVLNSLKKFRNFYDLVYLLDFTFVVEPSTVKYPDENWDVNKKHLVQSLQFKTNKSNTENLAGHQPNDVYRYDPINKEWVRAGLYYSEETGWDRLNYINSFYGYEIPLNRFNEYQFRNEIRNLFAEKVCAYDPKNDKMLENVEGLIDLKDIAFHQAFIKYLSGTDNRAKNTYYQIIGPVYEWVDEDAGEKKLNEALSDYKVRLIGDDLDTILATDNNGLQSKDYNLIEDSYDESITAWGDRGNIFLRMVDIVAESEIRRRLSDIMNVAGLAPSGVNETSSYFYKTFFKVQEDFPAIAYNHTAKIYYENAYAVFNAPKKNGVDYGGFSYLHNGVDPISQSHGSCLECEKQFMKERINFLSGYALSCLGNDINITGGSGGGADNIKLLLEFEPFQDFYPSYVAGENDNSYKSVGDLRTAPAQPTTYDDFQKSSMTRRYVAKAGENYVTKISDVGLHQHLMQVGMFKTLSITGIALSSLAGHFGRALDFTIDNDLINANKDFFGTDWPKMAIMDTITTVGLPVVLNLKLRKMYLPDTLDLSNYYKLQDLDLTGSVTKYVLLPQTGILKKVILPGAIDSFRIYNNPGLEEVLIQDTILDEYGNIVPEENLSNLKTVYIDCSKCGQFNVEEFCEKLVAVNVLEDITLVNANNLRMTEQTLSVLANKKCRITGSIFLVNNISDPVKEFSDVVISFSTKELLVKKFGNIVTKNNELFVNFKEKAIYETSVSCQETIHLYLNPGLTSATFENAFDLKISDGNDVIIRNTTPPTLDITYEMKRVSNMANIDANGIITITGNSTKVDEITITIKTNAGQTITKKCNLICSWVAPAVGDFAYADGSFSSAYNPNKTLVGLVYNKSIDSGEGTDAEVGTAYIIGKEYVVEEGLRSGLNYMGANAASAEVIHQDLYKIQYTLPQYAGLSDYDQVSGASGLSKKAEILPANETIIRNLVKTGKLDTLAYVEHVKKFLTVLRKDSLYTKYYDINSLEIPSLDTLLSFTNLLILDNYLSSIDKSEERSYQIENEEYNEALLYPYFYSMYLYQPLVLEGEELNAQYSKGNWYAPSVGELSIAMLCRGYSVSNVFTSESIDNTINVNATNENAIFAKAMSKMGLDFPSEWASLMNIGDNISTNIYTSGTDNYGYSIYNNTSASTYQGDWMLGEPRNDYGSNTYRWKTDKIWRLAKHKGVPFTQCTYAKTN